LIVKAGTDCRIALCKKLFLSDERDIRRQANILERISKQDGLEQ